MTWFGVVVAIYWLLNILAGAIYVALGDPVVLTPTSMLVTMFIQAVLLIGLFTVGTGLM